MPSARSSSPSSTCSSSSSGIATPPFVSLACADDFDAAPTKRRRTTTTSCSEPAAAGDVPLSAFDLLLSAASTMDDTTPPATSLLLSTDELAPPPHAAASGPAPPQTTQPAASSAAAGLTAVQPAQSSFPPAPSSTTSSSSSSTQGDVKMGVQQASHHAPSSGSSSGSEDSAPLRPEDLTSKGKKRKPAAACHKNKRRCSGDSPCANCEFSGRECVYLSSSGQRVSAPRSTRPPLELANSDASSSKAGSSSNVAPVAVAVASSSAIPGPSSSSSSSSTPGHKRTKSLVGHVLKQDPLSMGPSTLSDSFFAARSASMGGLAGLAGLSSVGAPSSISAPTQQSSSSPPVWDSRAQPATSSTRTTGGRRPSFASASPGPGPQEAPHVDPMLKRSLVKSFFEHFAEPLSSVFHKPTFFSSLYENRLSPLLLDAIFAWSARFSSHPSLVAISPERRLRGEAFANKVRSTVDRPEWVNEALYGSNAVDPDEEIERAQALVLLTVYESLLRRGTKTLQCLDILVPFVTRLTQQDNPPPPPTDSPPSRAASTARELRSRLFWTTYVIAASLEAQSGRSLSAGGPKGFSAQDCRLALPMSDDRFEMGACGDGLRSDGLTHPEGGSSKMLISELGHLARVQRIFRQIMSSVSGVAVPQSPRMGSQPVDHEASLKTWAQTLPSGLQFNEVNLKAAVDRIHHRPVGDGALAEETIGPGGDSGHAFAVLHTAAEVAMFFQLQSVRTRPVDAGQDQYLARRQSQAIENIIFVLNAVGEKGRQNPCLFFPLYIASKWKAQGSRHAADPNVAAWWAETGLLWGFDLDVILDRGFIDITPHSSPPTAVRPTLSTGSSFDSVAMSTTSSAGAPPSTAYTTALPSPQLERGLSGFDHRLPSIQALHPASQSMTGISLPSPSSFTPALAPSPGHALGLPSFRRASVSDASALPSFPLQQNLTPSPVHGYALPVPFPSSLGRQRSPSNASSAGHKA